MSLPRHIRDAILEYIPKMEGMSDPERYCDIAELVYDSKPKVAVEIGSFGCAGSLSMAFAIRENNNGGQLFCIDPWRLEYATEGEWTENVKWWSQNIDIHEVHKKAMMAIWAHNIDEWIVVIRAASQHCANLFPEIDFLVIDGNHSEIASFRDAHLYMPRVESGGLVLFDDADWQTREGDTVVQSTQKALALIETQAELVKQMGNMRVYRKR